MRNRGDGPGDAIGGPLCSRSGALTGAALRPLPLLPGGHAAPVPVQRRRRGRHPCRQPFGFVRYNLRFGPGRRGRGRPRLDRIAEAVDRPRGRAPAPRPAPEGEGRPRLLGPGRRPRGAAPGRNQRPLARRQVWNSSRLAGVAG
jgi:hypothetical protein